MLQQMISNCVISVLLICLSFTAYAESDSTRIGISVVIKAKQDCDYVYATGDNRISENSRRTDFYSNSSACGMSNVRLQQRANIIAASEFETTQSQDADNRLRVFMTVQ